MREAANCGVGSGQKNFGNYKLKTILLFREYLLPYTHKIVILCVLILGGAFFEGINIGLIYPLVDFIQKGDQFLGNKKFDYFIKFMEKIGLTASSGSLLFVLFITLAISFLFVFITQIYSSKVFFSIAKDIRVSCFKKIIFAPMTYFLKISSGRMVNMIKDEAECVAQTLSHMTRLTVDTAFILIYGTVAFLISWQLTLIVCCIAVIRYFLMGHFVARSRKLGQRHTKILAELNSYLISIYQGIDVVKTYVKERKEISRLNDKTENLKNNYISITVNQVSGRFLGEIIGAGLVCILVFLSFNLFRISGASLLILLFIIFRIIPKIASINDCRVRIADYTSKIVYLKEMLEYDFDTQKQFGDVKVDGFKNEIVFENVGFRYQDKDGFTLQGLDLKIRKNQTIAVIGESGAGKTTFIRLLLRLYSPQKGRILLDGVDIRDIHYSSWKNLISVVSQDTFIFDDTVENNILYAKENASSEDFKKTIINAKAEDFINKLPNKEKEQIGERGVKLSGGQRQRISIARAFLCDTPILVLDEATSSLDSITEQKIQKSLENLGENRTLIIIAHRFATIKNADYLIVFDKGNIVETGRHEELLAKDGLYKLNYMQQKF
jgi:subfamily B ATP-binding cassette protein MsbA